MRQKLIISGALVHRPQVIVVDEPMVGLDPKSARLLKELFRQFVDRGGTVLMSTHTMEVAEVMCDRIAIVSRGKIAAQGTMDELREQTASVAASSRTSSSSSPAAFATISSTPSSEPSR